MFFSTLTFGQSEIKVMCYNVLNYFANDGSRVDTLEKILDYYTPDLLMLQEIRTPNGFQEIIGALNNVSDDEYLGGTYVAQMSNPGSSFRLQQNIVYNTRIFGLADEDVFITSHRDINYFKLFLRSGELEMGGDTTFLHVYSVHLKSSQGFTNEQKRLQMAEVIKDAIDLLPANSNVLMGGDFNVYRSTEPAYQKLLEPAMNVQLIDPIDMPGNWHDFDYPNKEILTQSTRLTPLSDGAGGGLDDRFDFVLHSDFLHQGNPSLQFMDGSYDALGNNGTCFNQDLLVCTDVDNVPYTMISALYHFSDHLPVVFSLSSALAVSTEEPFVESQFRIFPNPTSGQIRIETDYLEPAQFILFDAMGRQVLERRISGTTTIQLNTLNSGVYYASIQKGEAIRIFEKIILHRE